MKTKMCWQADQIKVGDGYTFNVESDGFCQLVAKDKIELKPGFHAKQGSHFATSFDYGYCGYSKIEKTDTVKMLKSLTKYDTSFTREGPMNDMASIENSHFQVFSNPTHGIFEILVPRGNKNYRISLISGQGKLMMEYEINETKRRGHSKTQRRCC